ncbi:MAG TPA: hypothetical protein VFA28_20180 [Bryobacteraceae bacterium]|nr:hypothetical protein [Bryobacteraceae bacterium]
MSCAGEIIDRIAATIGQQVITDRQVIEQTRLTAAIEGIPVDLSAENKRKVLDRMIEQALVRREIEFTKFPSAAASETAPLLKQIKERYSNDEAFRRALAEYGVSEQALEQYLVWQVTFLRFVEYRFQPSVQITETEIQQEYRRQRAAMIANHQSPPTLDQMRPQLERVIRQRLTDAALDRWLGEMRTQYEILYYDGYKL